MHLTIIVDKNMVDIVQVRHPRSKCKRIQKKWRKNKANFQAVPKTTLFRAPNGVVVGHPETLRKLGEMWELTNKSPVSLRQLFGMTPAAIRPSSVWLHS